MARLPFALCSTSEREFISVAHPLSGESCWIQTSAGGNQHWKLFSDLFPAGAESGYSGTIWMLLQPCSIAGSHYSDLGSYFLVQSSSGMELPEDYLACLGFLGSPT